MLEEAGNCRWTKNPCNFQNIRVIKQERKYKGNIPIPSNKSNWRKYRSFKNFDVERFNTELGSKLSQIDFSEGRNVNEMYEDFTNTITSVTDKFAPQKVKKCIPKPVPYMNKSLKQAVYKKQMLFNKFQKYKTSKNWEKFQKAEKFSY